MAGAQLSTPERGQPRHPWYKERLQTKYLKESNNKHNFSDALNGHRWKFIDPAVDDFRDGYPPASNGISFQRMKGPSPVLQNIHKSSGAAEQKPRKRFTKEQAVFSKLLPLQQARREYIDEIEYGLTQHPLALYPHLEDGIPPELFEEIIDVLDPEMRLNSQAGSYGAPVEDHGHECYTPLREQQEHGSVKTRDISTKQSTISEESKHKNPYKWISTHDEEVAKEDKTLNMKHSTSRIPESVKQGTKEFCDWVTSLGGEHYNIEESTIFSLFASGFETKPALSVPIHVVELNNVPAELRRSVGVSHPVSALKTSHIRDHQWQSKDSIYHPSRVKIRYGAWYLDPKMWKKLKSTEHLQDPDAEADIKSLESRIRLNEKDAELMELHGTAAFKEFIESKGYRNPEFLMKIFAKKDAPEFDDRSSRNSREGSSKRSSWYRSGSASTHEETLIN